MKAIAKIKMTKILSRFTAYRLFFILILITQGIFSAENPRALAVDSRIKIVTYQPNNVVQVHAMTFINTQIVFGKDEIIETIQNGDLAAWTVSVQKGLANMLFLKSTILGSNTNMTVITNQHTYYFHLISDKKNQNQQNVPIYAIRFIYPQEKRAQLLAKLFYNQTQKRKIWNADKQRQPYNGNYSFNGARSITPLRIFDDGQFTYMQLQTGQAIPAIFAVNNASGKEAVVNYRRDGDYLIIQQIAPQFTLREGRYHVTSIFNNKLIKQLKNRGES